MHHLSAKANDPRNPFSAAIVFVYLLLAFLISSTHEPWADEAHAWLIARDASLYDLLFVLPHGEGNPSLWHLLLIIPAKYLGYDSLPYIGLLLGLSGVVVFVYFSPFSLPVKILFPFTFFVFYQYTVITRSYSLFLVLMMSLAALYKYRFEQPFVYTFILALLAYTHSFGTFVAASLMFLHVIGLLKRWNGLSSETKRNNVICAAIIFFLFCFIAFQILPIQHRTLTRLNFSLVRSIHVIAITVNESFTDIYFLSIGIFVLSLVWFWQRQVLLLYLVLLIPLFTFFATKYSNPWHSGLIFLIWVFVLWVGQESRIEVRARSLYPYTKKAMLACIYLVLGFHIYWAASISYADYHHKYSCSGEVADVLKQSNAKEGKIYARHYHTTAVSPYFETKLFYNINPGTDLGHWTWFLPDKTDDINEVLKSRPDAIVLGRKYRENEFDGYVRQNFKAYVFWKDRKIESNHCTVYVREELL